MIFNRVTGTEPIFFHAPGNKSNFDRYWEINKFWRRIRHLRGQPQKNQKIKILTCNNSVPGVFEQSLDALHYNYKTLSCSGRWVNHRKIDLFLQELYKTKEAYVVGADSFDVICIGDIDAAMERYASTTMLISAETRFYPAKEPSLDDCREFEEYLASNKYWKYLNSGIWMGPTDLCIKFFEYCKKLNDTRPHYFLNEGANQSDQLIFHLVYKEMYPRAKLDTNCDVFQTVTFCDYDKLWVKPFWL